MLVNEGVQSDLGHRAQLLLLIVDQAQVLHRSLVVVVEWLWPPDGRSGEPRSTTGFPSAKGLQGREAAGFGIRGTEAAATRCVRDRVPRRRPPTRAKHPRARRGRPAERGRGCRAPVAAPPGPAHPWGRRPLGHATTSGSPGMSISGRPVRLYSEGEEPIGRTCRGGPSPRIDVPVCLR